VKQKLALSLGKMRVNLPTPREVILGCIFVGIRLGSFVVQGVSLGPLSETHPGLTLSSELKLPCSPAKINATTPLARAMSRVSNSRKLTPRQPALAQYQTRPSRANQ
jgi:hypothetical protein